MHLLAPKHIKISKHNLAFSQIFHKCVINKRCFLFCSFLNVVFLSIDGYKIQNALNTVYSLTRVLNIKYKISIIYQQMYQRYFDHSLLVGFSICMLVFFVCFVLYLCIWYNRFSLIFLIIIKTFHLIDEHMYVFQYCYLHFFYSIIKIF